MRLSLISSLSWLISNGVVFLTLYDENILENTKGELLIIVFLSIFATIGDISFTLIIWYFSFNNWIVSREMPKMLLERDILTAENLKGKYCIPLEKIDEKSYSLI